MSGISLHGVFSLPVPLHLTIGQCFNGCQYCFVGNRADKFSLKSIEKAINVKDEIGLKNYYLKNRYPICISNTSDILNCKDKLFYWNVVDVLKKSKFPLMIETKGIKTDEDLKFFDLLDGSDIVYLTISHFGNNKYEPSAPSFENRIKTLEYCLKKGIAVAIGFNPIIAEVFDYKEALSFVKKYGKKIFGYMCIEVTSIRDNKPNYKIANALYKATDNEKNYQNMLPIYKYLIQNKIPAVVRYGIKTLFGFEYLGLAMLEHFKKRDILISDDLVETAKLLYLEEKKAIESAGKKIEAPVGLTWEDFYEICGAPAVTIKRNEIRCFSYFKTKALPKIMKYKDFLKIACNDFDFESPFKFTGLGYDKNNKLWWYPAAEFIKSGISEFKSM